MPYRLVLFQIIRSHFTSQPVWLGCGASHQFIISKIQWYTSTAALNYCTNWWLFQAFLLYSKHGKFLSRRRLRDTVSSSCCWLLIGCGTASSDALPLLRAQNGSPSSAWWPPSHRALPTQTPRAPGPQLAVPPWPPQCTSPVAGADLCPAGWPCISQRLQTDLAWAMQWICHAIGCTHWTLTGKVVKREVWTLTDTVIKIEAQSLQKKNWSNEL